jgi:hypothetical protein
MGGIIYLDQARIGNNGPRPGPKVDKGGQSGLESRSRNPVFTEIPGF